MAVRSNIVGIDSPEALERALRSAYYLADQAIATSAYLALALGKPLLLEGAPGVGKTEAAKAIAAVLERPAPDAPFGGKGPGEMCANPILPAVANAIFNAVGVRIDDLPITPEKVLRAIRAQGGAKPQARR